jgi:beta-glucan synthesis-associated protein KRE6
VCLPPGNFHLALLNTPHLHADVSRGGISNLGAFGPGGTNSTGQVAAITNLPQLIDIQTPIKAHQRVGFDGSSQYNIVFSDEFNLDGRTFWPGDDPFWEAQNMHYWQTGNLEWYDPDAISTNNGNLEIVLTEQPINGLNFRGGMLTTWNKLCFTQGYIEVNISLPGTPTSQGCTSPRSLYFRSLFVNPPFVLMELTVPAYTYDSCDVGTQPNQSNPDGTPSAARTSGSTDYGGELSWLPGQRTSACTCAGEDHPGPSNVCRPSHLSEASLTEC